MNGRAAWTRPAEATASHPLDLERVQSVQELVGVEQSITEVLHDPAQSWTGRLLVGDNADALFPAGRASDAASSRADPALQMGASITLNDFAAFLSTTGKAYGSLKEKQQEAAGGQGVTRKAMLRRHAAVAVFDAQNSSQLHAADVIPRRYFETDFSVQSSEELLEATLGGAQASASGGSDAEGYEGQLEILKSYMAIVQREQENLILEYRFDFNRAVESAQAMRPPLDDSTATLQSLRSHTNGVVRAVQEGALQMNTLCRRRNNARALLDALEQISFVVSSIQEIDAMVQVSDYGVAITMIDNLLNLMAEAPFRHISMLGATRERLSSLRLDLAGRLKLDFGALLQELLCECRVSVADVQESLFPALGLLHELGVLDEILEDFSARQKLQYDRDTGELVEMVSQGTLSTSDVSRRVSVATKPCKIWFSLACSILYVLRQRKQLGDVQMNDRFARVSECLSIYADHVNQGLCNIMTCFYISVIEPQLDQNNLDSVSTFASLLEECLRAANEFEAVASLSHVTTYSTSGGVRSTCKDLSRKTVATVQKLRIAKLNSVVQAERWTAIKVPSVFETNLQGARIGAIFRRRESTSAAAVDVAETAKHAESSAQSATRARRAFISLDDFPSSQDDGGSTFFSPSMSPDWAFKSVYDSSVSATVNPSNESLLAEIKFASERFRLTSSCVFLLDTLCFYSELDRCLASVYSLRSEIFRRALDLVRSFNVSASRQVLGANAIRTAQLKNISARHLCITARSVSLVSAFIRILCTTINNSAAEAEWLKSFDVAGVIEDLAQHESKLLDKMASVMQDRLKYHCETMRAMPWDNEAKMREEALPSTYMVQLLRETSVLHQVMQDCLPKAQVRRVFQRVEVAFGERLGGCFSAVSEVKGDWVRRRLEADVNILYLKLHTLDMMDNSSPDHALNRVLVMNGAKSMLGSSASVKSVSEIHVNESDDRGDTVTEGNEERNSDSAQEPVVTEGVTGGLETQSATLTVLPTSDAETEDEKQAASSLANLHAGENGLELPVETSAGSPHGAPHEFSVSTQTLGGVSNSRPAVGSNLFEDKAPGDPVRETRTDESQ
ncbi:Vacuolar protein sorting-associated protein 54, chloroplastic [Porphyridium purpureum]|uniref:Vacuolar protein sorting-associated protein 54 n=1 Tax=Porphyridium purpureum TaxID=35688 RepID=A0A5J4Z1C2_PORPP|nr:Vacuolar protein sorting-associated protein 54, chloroplastic [Porphyridium purpureum]|eukprot:POR4383..scf208_2